ncbi:TPA: hypothetical protein SMF39_004391 [Serratia marcescens]|nr:hypothetical protein [Serratia marcescens]
MSEQVWLIEVFRIHYKEQLSQNRIAKQLGLPRSTVTAISSALARLVFVGLSIN